MTENVPKKTIFGRREAEFGLKMTNPGNPGNFRLFPGIGTGKKPGNPGNFPSRESREGTLIFVYDLTLREHL